LRGVIQPFYFRESHCWQHHYNDALTALEQQQDMDTMSLYDQLAIADIQDAADVLRPVYEQTNKRDGYISFSAVSCSQYRGHDRGR